MTITEFAKTRGEQTQTISIYIRRHKKEFEGHIKQVGKTRELDEVALDLLDKQYPLPKPIEIIEDTESIKKLLLAQAKIVELQEKLLNQSTKLAQAESMELLLEDKKQQLEIAEKRNEDAQKEIERLNSLNLQLQEDLKVELNKSWWDKLRGK